MVWSDAMIIQGYFYCLAHTIPSGMAVLEIFEAENIPKSNFENIELNKFLILINYQILFWVLVIFVNMFMSL